MAITEILPIVGMPIAYITLAQKIWPIIFNHHKKKDENWPSVLKDHKPTLLGLNQAEEEKKNSK